VKPADKLDTLQRISDLGQHVGLLAVLFVDLESRPGGRDRADLKPAANVTGTSDPDSRRVAVQPLGERHFAQDAGKVAGNPGGIATADQIVLPCYQPLHPPVYGVVAGQPDFPFGQRY
jgi:hypothetical protein